MKFLSQREKRLWAAAGSLEAAIYASLYGMPFLINFLRDRNLLRLTVGIAFVAVAAALAVAVRRGRPGWREVVAVTSFAPLYAFLLVTMARAEEAFHFVEYGTIAALVYAALRERRRAVGALPGWRSAVAAILLTTAAGWLDEGIQYLLPNRYYDLRDVAFNATAATAAVAAVALRTWARRRDRAADRSPLNTPS